jgi:septal ring factor EnvC (AmiA/AmiB activator)
MKITDQVKNEFHALGYKDAKLGRKLSDADCFILSEAKRIAQTNFEKINYLADNYDAKLKSKKESLNIDSKAIQMWKKNQENQKKMDEINEAINILNNEIMDIEKDIKSLKLMITNNQSDEIESIFGTILYHYETGYLTYKYHQEKDQKSVQRKIDYSALTKDIINQYTRNLEYGKENLD